MTLDGEEDTIPHRRFIREGFAVYRDNSRREKGKAIPHYDDLMDMLSGEELQNTQLYHWGGTVFVRALHELVEEGGMRDTDQRYVYMEEKALLAALRVRSQLLISPDTPAVLAFLREWPRELGLDEAVVRKRFDAAL